MLRPAKVHGEGGRSRADRRGRLGERGGGLVLELEPPGDVGSLHLARLRPLPPTWSGPTWFRCLSTRASFSAETRGRLGFSLGAFPLVLAGSRGPDVACTPPSPRRTVLAPQRNPLRSTGETVGGREGPAAVKGRGGEPQGRDPGGGRQPWKPGARLGAPHAPPTPPPDPESAPKSPPAPFAPHSSESACSRRSPRLQSRR